LADAPVDRAPAIWPAQEDARQPVGDLGCHVPEGGPRTRPRRTLDLNARAIEVVELLEGLDQEVVDRKPDRPAPVRVSAKEARARFRGLIVYPVLAAINRKHVWVVAVMLGHAADPVGGEELTLVEHQAEDPGELRAAHDRQKPAHPAPGLV